MQKREDRKKATFLQVLKRSAIGFASMLPMILAVVGLVGLFQALITPEFLRTLFTGNLLWDTLVGTVAGGIAAGQAMVSYIIGGELLKEGISMYAVTAFVLSWVTLGVVQLPLEVEVLGMRFTILRNLLAFFFTILIAILSVWTVAFLS
jgi:uncharacterized membrane protein YraQ (UPF0718 family)